MRRLLYILLLVTGYALQASADNAVYWKKANEAYQLKQYDSAAAWYEQIAAANGSGTDLYYNLGNTYYKLNRVADATLSYERALFLDPGNKQAADNLALTQSRITNRIQAPADVFFVRWWQALSSSNNATVWAVIALASFLLLILLLLLRKQGKLQLPAQPYFLLGLLTLIWMLLAYTSAHNRSSSDKAVIMGENTPMATEAGQAKGQSLIPQGTTVTVSGINGRLASVMLPDGRTGWIQVSSLAFVQPGKH